MQEIAFKNSYPQNIQTYLCNRATPLAVEIANRWVLGWPETVTALIESDEYLEALERQEEIEREILANSTESHLSRAEILKLNGASLLPAF
jgi:hypothetical protein